MGAMGPGLAAIIQLTNFGLGVSGIALGVAGAVESVELTEKAKELVDMVNGQQKMIESYKAFQDSLKITSSAELHNRLAESKILLAKNIQTIREYFQSLASINALGNTTFFKDYKTIQKDLPGTSLPWTFYLSTGLVLPLTLAFTAYSFRQGVANFRRWATERGQSFDPQITQIEMTVSENVSDISFIVDEETSAFLSQSLQAEGGADFFNFDEVSLDSSASFAQRTSSVAMQGFQTFFNVGGAVLGVIGIALGIKGLIDSGKALDASDERIKGMSAQIEQFYKNLRKVLDNVVDFANAFQLQTLSYAIYTNQVMMIAYYCLMTAKDNKGYYERIKSIDMSALINDATSKIFTLRVQILKKTLAGFNTTTATNQQIADKFQQVCTIFQNLQSDIDVNLIYETFYTNLQISKGLLKELNFQYTQKLAEYINMIASFISKDMTQKEIEQMTAKFYIIMLRPVLGPIHPPGLKGNQLLPAEQGVVAQCVATFSKQTLGDVTQIFNHKLSQYDIGIPVDQQLDPNAAIQDVSADKLMPDWVKQHKEVSIGHITNPKELINLKDPSQVTEADLTYVRSAFYTQNRGGTEGKQDWRAYRVQTFQSNKPNTYYVLYDFGTDLYKGIRQNDLIQIKPK